MAPYAIALIGGGALARERDLAALGGIEAFRVVGVAEPHDGVAELDPAWGPLDAVLIGAPPAERYPLARAALAAGLHVAFDGLPAHMLGEIAELAALAQARGRTVYTAWPLQHTVAALEAKARLAQAKLRLVSVTLDEDMAQWRRSRDWRAESSTLGVFDAGLHVLATLTQILPEPVLLDSAFLGHDRDFETARFPRDMAAPSSAYLTLKAADPQRDHARMTVEFNWSRTGRGHGWEIEIETDANASVRLTEGGSVLYVDGLKIIESADTGCEAAYRRFAQLMASGSSEIDASAIELVDAAFSVGVNVTR